jgi:CRP-like cAMP-binding protein
MNAVNALVYEERDDWLPPKRNLLLNRLSAEACDRLASDLEPIELPVGWVPFESLDARTQVCFPIDAIVALKTTRKGSEAVEISVVGCEGMVGVGLFMGRDNAPSRAVVQNAGQCYSLSGKQLKDEFARDHEVRALVLGYSRVLLTQMAQGTTCNHRHTTEQELARWLLLSLDSVPTTRLTLSTGFMADMLGVARQCVTETLFALAQRGAIRSSRGVIDLLDRRALEASVCGCYAPACGAVR